MSLPVKDKIINHFITRYSLEKNLSKYLDTRNVATRKNMGTDYAINLVKKYLEINKRKYKKIYCLKIDIKKYFYNIDHGILKKLLKDKLSDYEYKLICKIIDSTNSDYINNSIKYFRNKYHLEIPLYQKGKGLPIGNITSQFLSIFYLYKLDHFIVHDLHLKYYVRYMDDFVIINHDKNKLISAKNIIQKKLIEEYKLNINNKKTMIVDLKDGFSFLGYNYKIINNKTIIKIRESNFNKIKKRIKKVKLLLKENKITYNQTFCTIMTYKYSYKYASNIKILNIIERYFYE